MIQQEVRLQSIVSAGKYIKITVEIITDLAILDTKDIVTINLPNDSKVNDLLDLFPKFNNYSDFIIVMVNSKVSHREKHLYDGDDVKLSIIVGGG